LLVVPAACKTAERHHAQRPLAGTRALIAWPAPRAAPQAFLLRKLKIAGSMGMAMKLPAVLEAAQPKAKL
jgi:hypothetical protein